MPETPNFILIPDDAPAPDTPAETGSILARMRNLATTTVTAVASAAAALPATLGHAQPPVETGASVRPRLVFAVDATASREPAWIAARQLTDTLVRALPGELDVALAVHGGSRVHLFSPFTNDPYILRDRAAGVLCEAGLTRLLPILSISLKQPAMRVVLYIGNVFEESITQGRQLADAMGSHGIKLIVLHDTADASARRDAEVFWDLVKRTGGCVLPFDANAPDQLRELLAAVAIFAVGGERLLKARRHDQPGAVALLEYLAKRN